MADEHKKDCKRGFEVQPLTDVGSEGGIALAHHEDHSHTLGTVVPIDPKKAPPGAIVLTRREDGVYVRAPLGAPLEQKGPANVNSEAYRAGWGRIFGGNKTPEVGQA